MKMLNGSELASYIKERQARQVRNLRQSWRVLPKLAIIQTIDDAVIDMYVRLKQEYGEDILVETSVHKISQSELMATIEALNGDDNVHGVIIQLPLADKAATDAAINLVAPNKDVDGLGQTALFTPATPMAIDWLLAGYNIELAQKQLAIVGNGRLVGAPLLKLWQSQGLDVTMFDESSSMMHEQLSRFDVIVTAAGVPRLIGLSDVKVGAVVIDAATSAEHGEIVGDVDDAVRRRDDITITPVKGGVGPLTVAALFDNVIAAARTIADQQGQKDL